MARSMIMQWRIRENLWLKVETSFFPTNHGRIPRALGRRTLRCCMSSLPWSSRSMCLSSGQWQYNYTYIIYIYIFKMIYISATIQLQQTSCPRMVAVIVHLRKTHFFHKPFMSGILSSSPKADPKGLMEGAILMKELQKLWWAKQDLRMGQKRAIF